jgi:biopolymer transport protein ExbB/TolQ
MDSILREILHIVTGNLGNPSIILLLVFVFFVIILIGEMVVEYFAVRFGKRLDTKEIILALSGTDGDEEKLSVLRGHKFQERQMAAFSTVLSPDRDLPPDAKRELAGVIYDEETVRVDRMLLVSTIILRIAPMVGLMATLIPLGPAMQMLGDGNFEGFGEMAVAFEATVAGLGAAVISFVVYEIKKLWYRGDLAVLYSVLNSITRVRKCE